MLARGGGRKVPCWRLSFDCEGRTIQNTRTAGTVAGHYEKLLLFFLSLLQFLHFSNSGTGLALLSYSEGAHVLKIKLEGKNSHLKLKLQSPSLQPWS